MLNLSVRFLSDETVNKATGYFIQYHNAMCFVIDLSPAVKTEFTQIRLFANVKRHQRVIAEAMQEQHGTDLRFELITSQKDFRRTRLGHIPPGRILKI